jgi:hypothetical protein
MARLMIFDARFANEAGAGQEVDSDLRIEVYEEGATTPNETRSLGPDPSQNIFQTIDAAGIVYTTTIDGSNYVKGEVTAKWYAKRNTTRTQPYPFIETLPNVVEERLNSSEIKEYIRRMLGFPSVAIELTNQHYTTIMEEALSLYGQWVPRERVTFIDMVLGQNAYILDIPKRGPFDVNFIRKEGTPLISDPLFGREYPRSQQLDFDQYVLGISFWETLNRVTCYSADTKVKLLDGTSRTMQELAGLYPTKDHEFWVYSYDCEKMRFVPGKARYARKIMDNAPIFRVTLDNGKHIDCTPNNKLLTRDGVLKRVDELKVGDSLMPLYSKREKPAKQWLYDYELIHTGSGEWRPTHQLVAEEHLPQEPKTHCLHHKDFDRFNNTPENLQWMSWQGHMEVHGKNWKETIGKWIQEGGHHTPEYRDNLSKALKKSYREGRSVSVFKELHKDPEWRRKNREALNASPKAKKQRQEQARKLAQNSERREICSQRMRRVNRDPEFARKAADGRRLAGVDEHSSERASQRNASGYTNHVRWHTNRGIVKEGCEHCVEVNHKIVSITYIGWQPIYDIEVDETHIFALDAGVYGKNSQSPEWWWDAASSTLYINIGGTNVAGASGNYFVMVRYFQSVQLDGLRNDHFRWFKRYCLCQAKKILGQIRGKFSGMVPAPGGKLQLNVHELMQEGQKEEDELVEEVRSMSPSVPPIHG